MQTNPNDEKKKGHKATLTKIQIINSYFVKFTFFISYINFPKM